MTTGEQPLKADKWWAYKVPPMLALAYYMLSRAEPPVPLATALLHLALFLAAVIGIVGFGYLLTDLFDQEEDRKSNSRNMATAMGRPRAWVLLLVLAVVGWLPWLYLPLGWPGLLLIGLEFILFGLYAVPPVRFKERGLPGAVTDALYAHVVPALVTWLTFAHLGGVTERGWFGGLLGLWALGAGLRHILHHQVYDLGRDRQAGVATFAVRYGHQKTMRLVAWIAGMEFLAFSLLQVVIGADLPLVAVGFGLHLGWQLFIMRTAWLPRGLPFSQHAGTVGYVILSRFYEGWWPVLIALGLAFHAPLYGVLVVIHVVLFGKTLLTVVRHDLRHLPDTLIRLRPRT